MPKAALTSGNIEVMAPTVDTFSMRIIGTRPLIFNRMAEKAKRTLLAPPGRKTLVERAASTKHDPFQEFRDSAYHSYDKKSRTYLLLPSPAFKGALTTAALDTPGVRRSEIGRLCWVNDEYVSIYGIPKLLMSVVRSADINKTPDIRTRAIVEHWCAEISVSYVLPKLNKPSIMNLVVGAGILCGVGDFRQEKGKGNYGQFSLLNTAVPEMLKEYEELVHTAGRAEQVAAMEAAEPFDNDSAELLSWWVSNGSAHAGSILAPATPAVTTPVAKKLVRKAA